MTTSQPAPTRRRRLPSLDLLSNVAILATCVVVAAAIWTRWDGPRTIQREAPFVEGTPAPQLAGVNYGAAAGTMVLYLRSTCRFCTASMPFYKTLAQNRTAGLRLVAVGDEPPDLLRAYLKQHGVDVDHIVNDASRPVPTPTILLVNKAGRVKNVWLGQQEKGGEGKIRAVLSRVS